MWDYNHEVGKSTQQPFKYQNVKESTVELDQLKEIIFDEGVHPDDLRLFAGT